MRIFELARRPPQWLRVVLAGLLLAFALNSVAHAAHTHDTTAAVTVAHSACGQCATFGGIAAAPVYAHSLPTPEFTAVAIADAREVFVSRRFVSWAQARAPPVH